MRRKSFILFLSGLVILVLLIYFVTAYFIETWVEKKVLMAVSELSSKHQIDIGEVSVSVFNMELELKEICIQNKPTSSQEDHVSAEIENVKLMGIHPFAAIFNSAININDVKVSGLSGVINIPQDSMQPTISKVNIRLGMLLLERVNLTIKNSTSSALYVVKEGELMLNNFIVRRKDVVTVKLVEDVYFKAKELVMVSEDSMYTFSAYDIFCAENTKNLILDSFSIHPNFDDYEFSSRSPFQTNCFKGEIKNIYVNNFSFADYLQSGNIVSSYIEIEKADLKVFRDKRKVSSHIRKLMFQELLYNYTSIINIDTISVKNGNVKYTEHASRANRSGWISFNDIRAKMYTISNDTLYKMKDGYFGLEGNALLMGKSMLRVWLKAKLFEPDHSFSATGTLSGLDAIELNPILKNNAFLYATSGRIDKMNFDFTANSQRAKGKMKLLYHGLDIAIKNKKTDDTTAFRERIVSWIANIKILDSNPIPGKEVREGIIQYERDPEKFLFNYCFKALLSGVTSSIVKTPADKKK